MAGFFATRDPDPARRRSAIDRATARLVEAGFSTTGTRDGRDTTVVWGARPGAPVTPSDDGVVLGDADGFHLTVRLAADGTLTVEVDVLGLLPVVHTTIDDIALAASSPHLLRSHDALRPTLDPVALAGVLALDGQVGPETVLRGVRRLPPGSVLELSADGRVVERTGYVMPVTDELHDVAPLRVLADRFHVALLEACQRHLARSRSTALLLSGGLDSRLLAGALREAGLPFEAISFGAPTDTEQRFAGRVAAHLGVPHRLITDRQDPEDLVRSIRWEGLVATPSFENPAVDRDVDRVVSGFAMDATAGGSHIDWAYDPDTGRVGWEPFFGKVTRHAVALPTLRRLLRPDVFGDALDTALADARHVFDAGGDSDAERAWRYDLAHRQRYWVGPRVPRQMGHSWPSLPHVDPALLALVGAMPLAVIATRALEAETCRAHYPDLARLPLDRATFEVTALVPRTGDMLRGAIDRKVRTLRARTPWPKQETRYYTRIFDIEGEAWLAARRIVEPARDAACELFDRAELARLLPPPGAPWSGGSSYPDANGAKLALGVMALLADGVGL
jgi:asparagine synthase (glutamine-hydrolysing)